MTVRDFAQKNSFEVISLPFPNREICGCYIGDLLSWVMGNACDGDAWITIMSNVNTVAVASLTNVACVILAESVRLEPDAVKKAEENGINIVISPLSAYKTALLIGRDINA